MLQGLRHKLNESNQGNIKLQEDLEKLADSWKTSEKDAVLYKSLVININKDLDAQNLNLIESEQATRTLATILDSMRIEYNEKEKELIEFRKTTKKVLGEVKSELSNKEKRIQNLETKVQGHEKEVQGIETVMQNLETEVQSLRKELHQKDNVIKELREEFDDFRRKISGTETS
jgi:chromosome segregation ATPase